VRVSIVLPTFNESENIGLLIQALRHNLESDHSLQFIVVDDSSADGTADQALSHLDTQIDRLIRRVSSRSLAGSILDGLRAAEYEQVLVMDTDFTHDPIDTRKLLSVAPPFDVVIGSRFVSGGSMASKRHYRASATFNVLVRNILGIQVRDCLGGFWTAPALVIKPHLCATVFSGYGDYFIRLACCLSRDGSSILEVPVTFKDRLTGTSKSRFIRMLFTYSFTAISSRLSPPECC